MRLNVIMAITLVFISILMFDFLVVTLVVWAGDCRFTGDKNILKQTYRMVIIVLEVDFVGLVCFCVKWKKRKKG